MRKFQRAAVVVAAVTGLSALGAGVSFADGYNAASPQATAVAGSQANAVATAGTAVATAQANAVARWNGTP
ncbi:MULTISPECIES: hypothetical protein [unclassified Streptomyces]|uniref:hypothetical protein n=1 Tax=unclassified Streptomyces TaxID=2593676 RepID=UPI0037FA4AF8